MEEIRFENYEGRDRQSSRFFHNENEREDLPGIAKLGIGAVIGAGLLATGHRTGAFRKIAHLMDTEGKAAIQAAKEVIHTQGSPFRGRDKLTFDRMKVLKDSFFERRGELLKDLNKGQGGILESREFQMQYELRRRQQMIGEKYTDKDSVSYHIQEGYRHNMIVDDVRQHPTMQNQPNVVKELDKALAKGELGILDFGTDDQIKLLLKNHGKGTDADDVWNVLKGVRDNYRRRDMVATTPGAKELVEGMQKKLRALTAERMQNQTQKNGAIKNTIIGHKQATVQDILDLNKAGKIRLNADLKVQINDVMKYNKNFGEAVFDENLYLSTKNGELFDYKAFSNMKRKQADWWANTIPGGLLHLRDILNVKKAREEAGIKIFQRGAVLSALNAHRGFEATEALNEEVMFVYGKFVKLNDVDAINNNTALNILNPKKDMILSSSSFGTMAKMHRHISGLMTDNETPRTFTGKFFDVGRQDSDSMLLQGYSMFSKFFKGDWERNRINNAITKGFDKPDEVFQMNTYFKLNTEAFTPRVLNNLKDQLPDNVKSFMDTHNLNFSRDEDMVEIFKFIGQQEKKKGNGQYKELSAMYRRFERDPDRILNKMTPIGESNPILGYHTQLKTGIDEIKQQTSLYLIHKTLMGRKGNQTYSSLVGDFRQELEGLHNAGRISRDELQKSNELMNYSLFENVTFDKRENIHSMVNRANTLFQNDESFQQSMRQMARRTNPMWERFSETAPHNPVGDEYLAMSASNIGGVFNKMFGIQSSWADRAEGAMDLFKQLSPFTGRKNLQDVSPLSMYSTYYPAYRLQDALGNMGLGFSDQSMKNSASIMMNLMFKRFLPIYGAVEGAQYINYETDRFTGEGFDERWENYKANKRLNKAAGRTPEEIYKMKRERMLHPGLEHWEDMPEVTLPFFGPISAGDALNNLVAPFFGKATLRKEDMMTYDETLDDLYNGEEVIRKSRFWFMGSKSAYRGDRVIEFAPNSFRKAHSDYEFTDTTATGAEKYSHSLFPTLENPLGGLSYLFGTRDPYWYEKKHYYDRPYMLTGELFNPNTMFFGDIGNATIGKLIKPVEEMHPEYWGDPVMIYEDETSKQGDRPIRPIQTEVSPAGRMKNRVMATSEDYGGQATYIRRDQLDEKGNATGAYVVQDTATGQSMYVPSNVSGDGRSTGELFQQAGTPAPNGTMVKGAYSASNGNNYQVQVSTSPRAMLDQEYEYKKEIMYRKMLNVQDPRNSEYKMGEMADNWSEPLGAYKWITGELMGSKPENEMIIQRADDATSLSNRFWESNIGSLGGDLSEIGRRFIRKDSGALDKYNPIRNTMPDWMPGDNYFINFQIGDPYSKLANGEYRLPGAAYESLNELHPDETGEYGAFDKFKILSDVAPWSEEYKFWSQYLLDTLPDGDLRKEATQIRKQVSRRKDKHEFNPYQFKGNDIVKEKVTVTKFLDDYTFLTKELGDTPIRLAGMQYRAKADGVLQQYFKVGDKVEIGINAEADKREAKDTYGTMRAVVFTDIGNINKKIIERGQMVEAQNDFSAPGVHARFTNQEIARGSRWETFTHMSSPLHTKFMQSRTALEEYERDQIYGKDWATWDGFLMKDYVVPTLQGLGRFDSVGWSGVAGATTGLLLGRLFLKGGRPTKISAIAGAIYGVSQNLYFKHYEKETGQKWIPERRRKEQDLNEYFDILKYLKYEGLYQKSREEIVHATGYDIEDFAQLIDEQKGLTKERRDELEAERKQLFLDQPKGWEDRRKEINKELQTISDNKGDLYLPEEFLRALSYKEQRDTTLYGVDPYDDRIKVMRAFPFKDKWFFQDFLEAKDNEKEKILKLIPENQRRIYQSLWGMEVDEKKPIEYYAEKYNLPSWDWEGWKPEYDLENIKAKAVKEAGLDMSDFNFWDDDLEEAKYTPDLNEDGNDFIPEDQNSSFQGFKALQNNLQAILEGQGLRDVKVSVIPSNGSESQVDFRYTEDRQKEIEEYLRQNGSRLM